MMPPHQLALWTLAFSFITGASSPVFSSELLVWINGDKGYRGLAEVGEWFEEELGVTVRVEAPENATDRFQQAAQAAGGPDIFFWAHDRMGEWADAGLLRSITVTPEFREQFDEVSWEAFTHEGQLWGYPVALEAVGLIYNRELVPEPPAQLLEAIALNRELQEKNGSRAIIWDYQNAFFTWGLLASDGGYIFGQDADGDYLVDQVGVAEPGSIAGLEAVIELIDNGVLPRAASYSMMEAEMNAGKLGMMISGPWAWGNLAQSGINFGVARLPGINGQPGRPFIGVLGAMLNRSTENRELAIEFLENYVLTDKGLAMIDNDVSIGVPAKTSFYESLAAENELIAASRANIDDGALMPSVPEMGRFWSSMGAALELSGNGQVTPKEALERARKNMTE